jgi:hypothetical protein
MPTSNGLISILDPTFNQTEQDFETSLTQKIIVTFFVALVASNLITVALDRNRRG